MRREVSLVGASLVVYACALMLALLAICGRVHASDVVGEWATQGNAAHVRVERCSTAPDLLCGFVTWLWEPIYSPENGRSYRASLKLRSPDILEVKGCLLGAMLVGVSRHRPPGGIASRCVRGQNPSPDELLTSCMKKKKRSARRARIELDAAVLRSFRVIYGSVRQHFRSIQESCGISGSQLWMLHEVRQAPGIGISELAARLSIHQSTGSLLVEKLVRAGFLNKTKSKSDQRRVGLQLSAQGQRCIKRAPGPPEGVLPEAIAGLSRSKARTLFNSLRAVIAGLDVRSDEAADTPLSDL